MQYNKNPISLREGHALIDGVEVMDGVKMTINFTPETWTGRQLNETTPSTRWWTSSADGPAPTSKNTARSLLAAILNRPANWSDAC